MPTYEIQSPDGKTYEVTAPDSASQADVLKYVQSQHVAAPSASPATPPQSPAGGGLESFLRSAANGATFNLADTIAAAGDATIPLDSGSSKASTWMQRYDENRSNQKARTSADQSANPVSSFAGSVAGGFANPVTRALPVAKTLGGAALQGAGIGGAYGAGGAIQNQDSGGDLLKNTLLGAGTGGALGAATYGLGNLLLKPHVKTAAAQALEAEGVSPTIGQSLGGSAQRMEDSYTSIPIFGDAIKDRQREGIVGFNRAAYNRVLEPLGIKYAQDAPVGNEGVAKIGDVIGKAYDHAFDGAAVPLTPEVRKQLQSVTSDAANVLPPKRVNMIQKNIDRLITSKVDENGQLSGDALKAAKNWFAEQARGSATDTMDERALAGSYNDVLDTLKSGIAQSDPERGALLKAADMANMRFVRVAGAAASNNASGKEGLFTPNQFGQAIRAAENSTRKVQFAKGLAPMQDLAQAGQQALSQTVNDSGTAMRSIFEHPLSAAATSPAWLAGRAAYSKPGQDILKALLFGAPKTRSLLAPLPQKALPGLLSLIGSSAPVSVGQ